MNELPDLKQILETLGLQPLPGEGGYYAESYRSAQSLPLPGGDRSLATAIYYLLTPDTVSRLHRLPGDEVYHYYLGDPVELLELFPQGKSRATRLGTGPLNGLSLQHRVPGGTWQGSRLVPGGRYALMGTTMSPGFDFADFEAGKRDLLIDEYRDRATLIELLTP